MSIYFTATLLHREEYEDEVFTNTVATFQLGNSSRLRHIVPQPIMREGFGTFELTPEEAVDWLDQVHTDFFSDYSRPSMYKYVADFLACFQTRNNKYVVRVALG